MSVKLSIAVPSIASVLTLFDRIKIFRSSTGAYGVYAEVTTPATRLPLQKDVNVYEFQDETGTSSDWYKAVFLSTQTGRESGPSDPQQGDADPALKLMSVEELKVNYLFGVDLTDEQGTPYPTSLFEFYIKAAVSYIERYLDMPLRPTQFEEAHDYDPNAWASYGFLQLNKVPVISIESCGVKGQPEFDASWLSLHKETGQLNIVPSGSMGLTGYLGQSAFLRLAGARFVPDAFLVKYTAGFEDKKCPEAIRNCIGTLASYGPLNIAGDLVGGAGLAAASLSIDGLSQSITTSNSSTNAGYGARLLEYAKHMKMYLPELRRSYRGLKLAVG